MNKFEQVQKGFHVCGDGGGAGSGPGESTCEYGVPPSNL